MIWSQSWKKEKTFGWQWWWSYTCISSYIFYFYFITKNNYTKDRETTIKKKFIKEAKDNKKKYNSTYG